MDTKLPPKVISHNQIEHVPFIPGALDGPNIVIPQPTSFSAALTHEVRNPLTNINLAVDILKRLAKSDMENVYLDIINRASLRISTLINELVKQQQDEHMKEAIYSVHHLLDEILIMTGDRILLKNIVVSKEYTIHDYNMPLHRPEMKIALTNIIINAIDAMAIQNGQLKIITKSSNGHYMVQIGDNGCGINPEDLKQIFKPFFTKKTGGLGIGLAATFDILKANKVKLHVKSKEGKGTKFILSFAKESPLFQ